MVLPSLKEIEDGNICTYDVSLYTLHIGIVNGKAIEQPLFFPILLSMANDGSDNNVAPDVGKMETEIVSPLLLTFAVIVPPVDGKKLFFILFHRVNTPFWSRNFIDMFSPLWFCLQMN